ncbi:hypothetical protein JQ557_18595 [Bradyrhizobium sp. U87765 SZCCT0131]|uniref:Dyp-type peroxidase n=1 Tax=unclassified Bradyrhizobium TaxID=2631580 RepID=UPI001BA6BF19|nr:MULTISPECIES: hypothetical protein [unclassified Bradyrhizobium]MBR1220020.1 hypothetical protein [Bradyrhizobium sp. U87765 SZCCT0131]MBR1263524.1 hypothetical protein [Bradyrhizobium sp. U87765 SZCCT0134]MBR1309093.1 hypothetical protein [Bradyrhizobium sp. U87765 SZCCT0110]MBR1323856.1 hypothetical protein [Bradyrhizobium sp. U87765 SZCCT0109]MBR1349408.1 hypothetical protein [Bradyrhizobium sp. U87765 SZCCT0048]
MVSWRRHSAAEAPAFCRGVQGNILKGHDRDHAALLLVTFGADAAAARAWIAGALRRRLKSAADQAADTERWHLEGGDGAPFVSFYLSRDGYVRLGVPDAAIPRDPYFRAGMKASPAGIQTVVSDPPVAQWDAAFQGRIDALVLLGDDNPARLASDLAEIRGELQPITERVAVETGRKLLFDFPGRPNVEIEHFGHQDGISQPQMIKQEAAAEVRARGGANWNPAAPLSLAFAEEAGAGGTFGSYLVLRKLEQHVGWFHAARDAMAAALGIDSDAASALAVGRRPDGTPAIPTTVVEPGADPNDFNFKADAQGGLCPFQSHIRKTNPRGDLARFQGATDEIERGFRIARRGISYGERPDLARGATVPPPDTGVGLLFMSYQAQLRQFVIQQEGSDSNDFVQSGVGVDAVIGNNPAPVAQRWPANGVPTDRRFSMAGFVTFKGGEYFFAPSFPFIESLSPSVA